jgi:uncharacterized protein DUF4396
MHCVPGDGIGILVGAVIGALIALPMVADMVLEYVLGFAFGWTIFQALFMGEMFSSYARSLKGTFTSELLSMNCLMAGMMPVAAIAFAATPGSHDPSQPLFWFRMSLALMFGAVIAYPSAVIASYTQILPGSGWTVTGSGGAGSSNGGGAGLQATNGPRYLSINVGGPAGTTYVNICVWPSRPNDDHCGD